MSFADHQDFDTICVNCKTPFSQHAAYGDWCPAENEDQLWSTTSKFLDPESVLPSMY